LRAKLAIPATVGDQQFTSEASSSIEKDWSSISHKIRPLDLLDLKALLDTYWEVIAVVRSVSNDYDSRWLSQRLHGSIGCPVDLNPRFGGRLLLVISAGTVEHSVAQNYSALSEN
jgi:hypothetical protein